MMARVVLLIVPLILTACAAVPQPQPNVYFRLDAATAPPPAPLTQTIVVEPFHAQGLYAERPLIWAEGSMLQQYFRHFWAKTPSVELQESLIANLRAAGATRVFRPQDRQLPELVVRGRVERMELQTEGPRRAVLALEFLLTDPQNRLLRTLRFEREKPVGGKEARDYVQAQQQLAAAAFAELAEHLTALAATAVPAPSLPQREAPMPEGSVLPKPNALPPLVGQPLLQHAHHGSADSEGPRPASAQEPF